MLTRTRIAIALAAVAAALLVAPTGASAQLSGCPSPAFQFGGQPGCKHLTIDDGEFVGPSTSATKFPSPAWLAFTNRDGVEYSIVAIHQTLGEAAAVHGCETRCGMLLQEPGTYTIELREFFMGALLDTYTLTVLPVQKANSSIKPAQREAGPPGCARNTGSTRGC
jgi:hypothetical protein